MSIADSAEYTPVLAIMEMGAVLFQYRFFVVAE
jgi:hypothetical protein